MEKWLKTNRDDLFFEDTTVGRLKKKIWEASEDEITQILDDYGVPGPPELAKPGTYIQTTIRHNVVENRKKNDILIMILTGAGQQSIFSIYRILILFLQKMKKFWN